MEDNEIPVGAALSEWQPITSKVEFAILAKFGEELCEAGASVFRCIIQGVDEKEPKTDKVNKEWLEDEIADVLALMGFVRHHFNLDEVRIAARTKLKREYKTPWFASLMAAAIVAKAKGETP